MKKYIVLILTAALIAIQVPAQTLVNRAGPANTVQDARLAAQRNFTLPRFNNLAAADADLGLDYEGALIYNRENNTIYYRQMLPKAWVKIMSTSNGGNGSCGLGAGGLVTWAGTGLTYDVTSAAYCINDNGYYFGGGSITLDAAHASLDRFDVLALGNTGSLIKITGTPNANPQVPSINPATQLYLTAILVRPGGGAGFQTVLWNENTGSPEWTVTHSPDLTADFDATNNPYNGSVNGNVTDLVTGSTIRFYGNGYQKNAYSSLKFFIDINGLDLAGSKGMSAQLISDGNIVTAPLQLTQAHGLTGVTGYQNITIPISNFNFLTDVQEINGILFTYGAAYANGFDIDYLTLNGGVSNPGNGGNYVTSTFKRNDSVFYVVNGMDYFSHLAGGGENFANADLNGTENRYHSFGNKNVSLSYLDTISFIGYPEHDTTILFNGSIESFPDDLYTSLKFSYNDLTIPISDITLHLAGGTVVGYMDGYDDSVYIYYPGILTDDVDSISFTANAAPLEMAIDVPYNYDGVDQSNIAFFDGNFLKKGYLNIPFYSAGPGLRTVGSEYRINDIHSPGTELIWYSTNGAFRAGTSNGSEWSTGSLGSNSAAFGTDNRVSGNSSFSSGINNNVSGNFSTLFGQGNATPGHNSFLAGYQNISSYNGGVFGIGDENTFTQRAFVVGNLNVVNGIDAYIIGSENDIKSSASRSYIVGHNNDSYSSYSFAMGRDNDIRGDGATTIGRLNFAAGTESFAIGNRSYATGKESISIGNSISNLYFKSIAVGYFNNGDYVGDSLNFNNSNRTFQIGNGTSNGSRSNALTVLHNGNVGIGNTANTLLPTDRLVLNGNLSLDSTGNKIKIATGINASAGISTMTAGSVIVNTTAVTSSSLIFLTPVGTGSGIISLGTITNGTSFAINSSDNTDTRDVQWWIIN